MKFLFDFFPILLFFAAYKIYGIYTATAVAIAASVSQVGISWVRSRAVEKMHLVTLGLIVVLGGATLWLQNEQFIKWKPTAVNWAFALAFLASRYIGRKTLVERMMGNVVSLPAVIWTRLNISWVVFFVASGAANVYVIYNFDTDTWVNFKLFGMMGMTFAFVVAQAFYLARHMEEKKEAG